jgi:hypothetical protein
MAFFTSLAPMLPLLLSICIQQTAVAYSTGDLNSQHIAGIWRLKSKQSFMPRNPTGPPEYPLKEFTVIPLPRVQTTARMDEGAGPAQDVFLLLREDGKYAQFYKPNKNSKKLSFSKFKRVEEDLGVMEGTWALVDG